MSAIYTVFTSPHHAPMPNHLPTLIVTPHGQPSQVLYTYLHTEENRVNYLLTPSPQGDLCVAKMFPPPRTGATSSSSLPTMPNNKHNVVRCEASRDLKWTIENTGVQHPTYKIVNQDETPLYQISKPNPNADWWTMFYFKYAGHQIPPRRVEFGKVSKNPPEKGGGTRITITGNSEDEKQVWQTLGVGNEDCVEWVVCCAALNLLDDQILIAAERKQTGAGPASTAPNPAAPAASRPAPRSQNSFPPANGRGIASTGGPGIASTGAGIASTGAGIASTGGGYRGPPPQQGMGAPAGRPQMGMGPGGPQGRPPMGRPPMQQQQPPQGYPQQMHHQQQPPQGFNPNMRSPANPMGPPGMARAPPQAAGRRF